MSYCTPCPPCDTEFPLLCEPLETTANGKRLVVEDSAACQKTIQSPVSQQVLKTDGANNLTWTNGANSTVLGKDSTGLVEFATLNSVLQAGPVDLGNQPLTTTGAVSTGAITATSVTTTGAVNAASVTTTGIVTTTGEIAINRLDSINEGGQVTLKRSLDNATGWYIDCYGSTTTPNLRFATTTGVKVEITNSGNVGIGTSNPIQKLDISGNLRVDGVIYGQPSGTGDVLIIGNDCKIVDIGYPNVFGIYGSIDENLGGIRLGKTGPLIYGATNNFGVNTATPAKTLHVNGTVRLQGLPVYANNAAAITGGLVADDVYKTSTGELRIVF